MLNGFLVSVHAIFKFIWDSWIQSTDVFCASRFVGFSNQSKNQIEVKIVKTSLKTKFVY